MIEAVLVQKFSPEEVLSLLEYFDDSYNSPLHLSIDMYSYSKKLSDFAHFIVASEDQRLGFVAFYLNDKGAYIYISQIAVHKLGRHNGIGHLMLNFLIKAMAGNYHLIRLEVLKDNANAQSFYTREGFYEVEDRGSKLLMEKKI